MSNDSFSLFFFCTYCNLGIIWDKIVHFPGSVSFGRQTVRLRINKICIPEISLNKDKVMFTENKYKLPVKGSFKIGWIENYYIPSPVISFKVVILWCSF